MNHRPVVATIYRAGEAPKLRYYARISTALPRGVAVLLQTGQPGDIIEYASNDHGYQIATVSVHAGGKIDVQITLSGYVKKNHLTNKSLSNQP